MKPILCPEFRPKNGPSKQPFRTALSPVSYCAKCSLYDKHTPDFLNKSSRGWMALQRCRKMDQPTSGFRSANPTKERPRNEFALSCFWRIPFFLTQNALLDDDKERPKNAKERLALKLCPLSGKTAFFGIALWKNRIFKRKNAKPKNARSPPRPPPQAQAWHILTRIRCSSIPLT